MPLFYFDLSNGTRETDEEGIELASVADAQSQAVKLIGEFGCLGSQVFDLSLVATMLANGLGAVVTNNTKHFARFSHLIQILPLTADPQ